MPTTILLMPSVKCTKCQSTNLVKAGFNRLGNQQYKCKDCGSVGTFSGNKGNAKKRTAPCLVCGSLNIYAKGMCQNCYRKEKRNSK